MGAVYGEARVNLPALPELMNVLWEMGIYPSVRMLTPTGPQVFESVEAAVEEVSGAAVHRVGRGPAAAAV